MKAFARIFIFTAMILMTVGIKAQTTTEFNFAVPAACGVYNATYTCNLQAVTPTGNNAVLYAPHSGYPFGYLEFKAGDTYLSDLGYAKIDSVTTTFISSTTNGKKPNTQGFVEKRNYVETTTFHEQNGNPIIFTGSTTVWYTTTTQCCSSGKGASEHTTYVITGGFGILNQ